MLIQKSGNIINISAINGLLSTPYTSAYSASKAALEGYTEALRLELLPFNVFVSNTVSAYVNTGTTDFSLKSPKQNHPLFEPYREHLHNDMLKKSPKGIAVSNLAKKISDIIADPFPKYRYKLDKLSKQLPFMAAIFPEKFFQKNVLKSLKMPLKVDY